MDSNTSISHNREGGKSQPKVVKPSLAVVDAEWVKAFVIRVFFNDDTQQEVDFGPYLATHSHPYINPFKNQEQFKTFYINNGNLVWGTDWDMIFPTWQLHRGCIKG